MVHLTAVESIWSRTPKVGGKDELKEEKENLSNREKKKGFVFGVNFIYFFCVGEGWGILTWDHNSQL